MTSGVFLKEPTSTTALPENDISPSIVSNFIHLLLVAKELGLELVSQTDGGLGSGLLFLLRLSFRSTNLSIASTSTAGVEVSAVLTRSDRNLGDDVLILSLGGRCAYIANVSSTYC